METWEKEAVLTSYWHTPQMLQVIFLPAICTLPAILIVLQHKTEISVMPEEEVPEVTSIYN